MATRRFGAYWSLASATWWGSDVSVGSGSQPRLRGDLSEARDAEDVPQDDLLAGQVRPHEPQEVVEPFTVLPGLDVGGIALLREFLESGSGEAIPTVLTDPMVPLPVFWADDAVPDHLFPYLRPREAVQDVHLDRMGAGGPDEVDCAEDVLLRLHGGP